MKDASIASKSYVCSRHFCRSDFQEVKSNQRKYILKQGTLPTIFKWDSSTPEDSKAIKTEENSETALIPEPVKDEVENPIEPIEPVTSDAATEPTTTTKITQIDEENKNTTTNNNKKKKNNNSSNSRKRAGSILIPTEEKPKKSSKRLSAAKIATTPASTVISDVTVTVVKSEIPATPDRSKSKNPEGPPPAGTPKKKNTIINFLPGSTIEAQSFDQKWITVKVIEVDIDEREVLVRFEKNCKSKTPG